ncbi:molecular chaperone [Noviherbaspirillum agri]
MNATEAATISSRAAFLPLPQEDQARADMYALMANLLLRPPDAQLLSVIAEASPLQAAQPQNALARTWNALIDAARTASLRQVEEQFDALFIGTGTPRLNPYASYYLAGFLMEKPLAALRDDLAVLGLQRRQGTGELEDHLGALCEAMCMLISGAPDLPRRTTQEQKTFFTRHIAPWFARCLDDIRRADETADEVPSEAPEGAYFYRHIADFAEAFLQLEVEAFAMERDAIDDAANAQQHAMEGQTR